MNMDTDPRPAHRARVEQEAMDNLVDRLAVQFPELPAERIVQAVRGEYDGYAAGPVRDFVPVLVERSVKSTLSHTGARHRA